MSGSLRLLLLAAPLILGAASVRAELPDWMADEDGVLELRLAHDDAKGPDGGILRVDATRRLLLWEGVPGELGCQQRVEASFDDVRRVTTASNAGFSVEFRKGKGNRLVLIPLPHAAWLVKQWKVKEGGVAMAFKDAQLSGPGGEEMLVGGATASAGARVRKVELPREVVADTRLALDHIQEALGRPQPLGEVMREALFGAPTDAKVAELIASPSSFEARPVRLLGRVAAVDQKKHEYRLTQEGATVRLVPTPEIAALVAQDVARWGDRDVEITGLVRRGDVTADERNKGPQLLVSFWDFMAPEDEQPALVGGVTVEVPYTTLESLVSRQGLADGRIVRVVAKFRGRNLFGDLPAKSQRNYSHWVVKDDRFAAWVTNARPRGKGWKLDPDSSADTEAWLDVVARPQTRDGILYLKALRVSPTAAPSAAVIQSVPRLVVAAGEPPVVVFALPVEGEELPMDGRLIVQFSKRMAAESFKGRVVLRYADGRSVGGLRLVYDDTRRALVVVPGELLKPGHRIELLLLPGILDADGLALQDRGRARENAVEVLRYDVGT